MRQRSHLATYRVYHSRKYRVHQVNCQDLISCYNMHLMAQKSDKKPEQELIGKNTVITLNIPWKEAEPAYKQALAKLSKTVKASGFRQGKVPAELAEQMIGAEKIVEEALQKVVPPVYEKTVIADKKQPVTYPEFNPVSIEPGKDWVIEAYIAERPTIKLKDYKKAVKAAIKEGNKKIAEAEKEHEKAHKEGKHADDHDHNMSDEQKNDYRLQHIYQALVRDHQPIIQELLIKHEVRADVEQLNQQLSQVKLTIEEYLKRRNMTFEQLSQEMTINALGKLQIAFMMDAVAQDANITVSDADIDAYIEEKVDKNMSDTFKKNQDYRRMLANTLLRQKISDYLLAL